MYIILPWLLRASFKTNPIERARIKIETPLLVSGALTNSSWSRQKIKNYFRKFPFYNLQVGKTFDTECLDLCQRLSQNVKFASNCVKLFSRLNIWKSPRKTSKYVIYLTLRSPDKNISFRKITQVTIGVATIYFNMEHVCDIFLWRPRHASRLLISWSDVRIQGWVKTQPSYTWQVIRTANLQALMDYFIEIIGTLYSYPYFHDTR